MTDRAGYNSEDERIAAIVKILRKNPQGLTSEAIIRRFNVSQHTIRKTLTNTEQFKCIGRGRKSIWRLEEQTDEEQARV